MRIAARRPFIHSRSFIQIFFYDTKNPVELYYAIIFMIIVAAIDRNVVHI